MMMKRSLNCGYLPTGHCESISWLTFATRNTSYIASRAQRRQIHRRRVEADEKKKKKKKKMFFQVLTVCLCVWSAAASRFCFTMMMMATMVEWWLAVHRWSSWMVLLLLLLRLHGRPFLQVSFFIFLCWFVTCPAVDWCAMHVLAAGRRHLCWPQRKE